MAQSAEATTIRTIMMVDDSDDLRELFGAFLRRQGYTVHEAENGADALEQLDAMHDQLDLLLLDMTMPVMSGAELLKVLHDAERLSACPIVVFSGSSQPGEVPQATRFIRKPASFHMLLTVLRELGVRGTRRR